MSGTLLRALATSPSSRATQPHPTNPWKATALVYATKHGAFQVTIFWCGKPSVSVQLHGEGNLLVGLHALVESYGYDAYAWTPYEEAKHDG